VSAVDPPEIQQVRQFIGWIYDQVEEAIKGTVKEAVDVAKNIISKPAEIARNILEEIYNAIVTAFDSLKNATVNAINSVVNDLVDTARRGAQEFQDWVAREAKDRLEDIKKWLLAPLGAGETRFARATYRSLVAYGMTKYIRKNVGEGVLKTVWAAFTAPIIYSIAMAMEPFIVNAFSQISPSHGMVPATTPTAPPPATARYTPVGLPPSTRIEVPLRVELESRISAVATAEALVSSPVTAEATTLAYSRSEFEVAVK